MPTIIELELHGGTRLCFPLAHKATVFAALELCWAYNDDDRCDDPIAHMCVTDESAIEDAA